jgi:hypothetical protein
VEYRDTNSSTFIPVVFTLTAGDPSVIISGISSEVEVQVRLVNPQGQSECMSSVYAQPASTAPRSDVNITVMTQRYENIVNGTSTIILVPSHPQATRFSVWLLDDDASSTLLVANSSQMLEFTCTLSVVSGHNCSAPFISGHAYSFVVEASNSFGKHPSLRFITVNSTFQKPLSSPSQLRPVEIQANSVSIVWENIDNANFYQVQSRPSNSDLQYSVVLCGYNVISSTTFVIDFTETLSKYDVRVLAGNQFGIALASGMVLTVQATDSYPFGQVQVIAIVDEVQVSIECSHPGALTCIVEIRNSLTGQYLLVGDMTSPGSKSFTTLSDGVTSIQSAVTDASYVFRVRAANNHGQQPDSEAVLITKSLGTSNSPPSNVPPTVKRIGLTRESITLYFDQPTAFLFKIEVLKADGTWQLVAQDIQTTSYTITCLEPTGPGGTCVTSPLQYLTTYYFRVTAGNSAGYQHFLYSAPISAKPTDAAPVATIGLRAKALSNSTIALTWTDQPDAVKYRVQIQAPGSSTFVDATGGSSVDTTEFTVTNLQLVREPNFGFSQFFSIFFLFCKYVIV